MRVLLLGLVGPLVALVVVWQPPISIAGISAGEAPDPETVERSRNVPDDDVLREIRDFAVSYPGYDHLESREVLSSADAALENNSRFEGAGPTVPVPFRPGDYLLGSSTWHLEVVSFAMPSLLGRAYEVSGSEEYLQAAIRYIRDWCEYESSLLVPRGMILNDHAIAARAIVMTEVWRLYRQSEIYDPDVATDLLRYVRKLARLLMDQRLYEYRSNHGIMQNLSLLHLALAFPALLDADRAFEVGAERLNDQLEYFVNAEGVVLEHSAGYHWNGVRRLSAAWRYLGLGGFAVTEEMIERYQLALEFSAALRRPDGTLPLIGDTSGRSYTPHRIAEFDADSVASAPLRPARPEDFVPVPLTVAPAAGFIVLWNDLDDWPESRGLDQTVLHWGNFPSRIHKHADEMGISIWAGGSRWVRAVGSWPYSESRAGAIGWRSSNAPHWMDEVYGTERSTSLVAFASDGYLSYFDLVRSNADGRALRRQLVKLHPGPWVVVDSFDADVPREVETLWRFSPELSLREMPAGGIEVAAGERKMHVAIDGNGDLVVETDPQGTAEWNAGLIADDEIVPGPAIRIQANSRDRAFLTAFELQEDEVAPESGAAAELQWNSASDWTVQLGRGSGVSLRRKPGSIGIEGPAVERRELIPAGVVPPGADAAEQALAAYYAAAERYGEPFQLMLERRAKVTVTVVLTAVVQIALFLVVASRLRRWWPPLLIVSSVAWAGLSLFLGLGFLG